MSGRVDSGDPLEKGTGNFDLLKGKDLKILISEFS